MQPLHYDLQCPAAKDNSITHAAAAPSNLDAAITMRFAKAKLQNTKELRATASEIAAPKPDLDAKARKIRFWNILKHFLKRTLKGKSPAPKLRKSADKTLSQPWLMLPHQYDLRCPAAKENSNTHTAAAAPSNLDAAITMRDFPSNSDSWRCQNEAFARDFSKVQDVKSKLSCETSLQEWKWKMRKRSFRARPPSKSESGKRKNEAFVRDFLQILKVQVQVVKMTPELHSSTARPIRAWSDPNRKCSAPARRTSFPTHLPRHVCPAKQSISCIRYLSKNIFRARLP